MIGFCFRGAGRGGRWSGCIRRLAGSNLLSCGKSFYQGGYQRVIERLRESA